MEIISHLGHPGELYALFKYKLAGSKSIKSQCDFESMSADLKTCYDFLNKTSRSFAAVIQALDGELRDAVCLFYLVLRALDTVEDDMKIPERDKILMLKDFHKHLQEPNWCFMKSSEKDKIVLEKFPVISREFRRLSPVYQTTISEICAKMGAGMAEYIDRAPSTLADWDQYCHYVAGLVGIGLSQLFSASGLEDASVGEDKAISNSMGLFLQKANIIRDYLEDVEQGRHFWPREVWSKYGRELRDFSRLENREAGLCCLNELVTNALAHVPDVLMYMGRIQNQSVFNFCAIPQVMAIATLERCYNNPRVFEKVVKIRKGEAVKMIMNTTNMESIKSTMSHFCIQMKSRIPQNDPSAMTTESALKRALDLSSVDTEFVSSSAFYPIYVSGVMLAVALSWQYWHGLQNVSEYIRS